MMSGERGRLPYLGDNYNELLTTILMARPLRRFEFDQDRPALVSNHPRRMARNAKALADRRRFPGRAGQTRPSEGRRHRYPTAVVVGDRPSIDDLGWRHLRFRARRPAPGAHDTVATPAAPGRRIIGYRSGGGDPACRRVALVLSLRHGGRGWDGGRRRHGEHGRTVVASAPRARQCRAGWRPPRPAQTSLNPAAPSSAATHGGAAAALAGAVPRAARCRARRQRGIDQRIYHPERARDGVTLATPGETTSATGGVTAGGHTVRY